MHLNDDELKTLWQQETRRTTNERTECLSSELLVRAGEGTLAAAELAQVTSHLEQCADCAEEYRLAAAMKDWSAKAATTHADVLAAPTTKPATKPARSWGTWFHWQVPALAFASLALLALAWFAWRAWGNKNVQHEIVTASPTPTPTATVTATATPLPTPSETPTAPLVAQLQDGQQLIALNQQGELSGADHLPPAYQQMVKEALTTQRLERSASLTGLHSSANVLRGSDEQGNTFALLQPVGKVVRTPRPMFRWSSLAGASSYVIEIYDAQFNLVASGPRLTKTNWTATQSLPRDQIFSWQVKAEKDGQEIKAPQANAPQATFRVLSQTKANELAQAQRKFGASHLTLGLLYAEAGLLDEAEQEFRALQKANPSSPLARRLLANVRALRR